MQAIRVLIADDQALYRGLVRATLESEPDMEVVGEAADGLEAVALTAEHLPDVVLMDIRMPKLAGIEAAATLHDQHPDVRVLMLTISDDESDLCDAIVAGALGYLLKDEAPDEIVRAVRQIHEGRASLSPWLAARLVGLMSVPTMRTGPRPMLERLSPADLSVLRSASFGRATDDELFDVLEKVHAQPRPGRHITPIQFSS